MDGTTLDLFEYLKDSARDQVRGIAESLAPGQSPSSTESMISPSGVSKISRDERLNSCQKAALEALRGSENIFLTGVAGSGKSYLIQHYLYEMDRKENPVLASTGAAAILVGGRTFHSFFGLGILQGGVEATIERALENKRVVKRLKKTKSVIIDEVSMISGTTLRVAETIAREARESELPWGGLRVVTVGDFAQLPPVTQGYEARRDWAFQDLTWERSAFASSMLRTTIRTKDESYLKILNEVREGRVTPEVRDYLTERCVPAETANRFEGTRLFPHRDTVERFNLERLQTVSGSLHEFATEYGGEEKFVEDLKKAAPIPDVLRLKEGALVMLRQNDPMFRWVNGSLGQVEKIDAVTKKLRILLFETGSTVEIEPATFSILNAEGAEIASARNFPVNLAYATTIHKSQGMTLDRVLVDLRHLWEPGQAYVAMSRVKAGSGLNLLGWTPSSIRMDPSVAAFYQLFR